MQVLPFSFVIVSKPPVSISPPPPVIFYSIYLLSLSLFVPFSQFITSLLQCDLIYWQLLACVCTFLLNWGCSSETRLQTRPGDTVQLWKYCNGQTNSKTQEANRPGLINTPTDTRMFWGFFSSSSAVTLHAGNIFLLSLQLAAVVEKAELRAFWHDIWLAGVHDEHVVLEGGDWLAGRMKRMKRMERDLWLWCVLVSQKTSSSPVWVRRCLFDAAADYKTSHILAGKKRNMYE